MLNVDLTMPEELVPKQIEFKTITERDIVYEQGGVISIEDSHFDRIALNIGGAPLLGSLHLSFVLREGSAIVSVDPNSAMSKQILSLLNSGNFTEIPLLLNNSSRYRGSGIPDYLFPEIRKWYESYWNYLTSIQGRTELFGIKERFESLSLQQLTGHINTIACYYPPVLSLSAEMLAFKASKLLQPGGEIEVLTERNTFRLELIQQLRKVGFDITINGTSENTLANSLYDIIALSVLYQEDDIHELYGRWHILAKKPE